MSLQGIVLIDLVGLALIILLLNLVRTHRLHVSYAALWLMAVTAVMTIISIPPVLGTVTAAVGAIYPASAISLLAFVFIFIVLIAFSVQLSSLSARLVDLAQAVALKELATREQRAAHAPSNVAAQHPGQAARSDESDSFEQDQANPAADASS
jgi:hypothetical protein